MENQGMSIQANRRDFLHVGFAAGIGLTLADFLRLEARAEVHNTPSKEGVAKSVIFIYLPGGAPHQETFDPKPFAPVEYRGPMGSIATKVDGIMLNECMAQTAKIADKIALCRSMTHGEAAHERGTHNMFTGYKPSPALAFPSMGSVVTHEFPPKNNLPQYVCIPSMPTEFAGTGYLSSSFAPFSLGSDPADGGFRVQDLKLPGDVPDPRFVKRRRMLDAVNDYFVSKEKADSLKAVDTFYQRAYSMVSSVKAQEAFDISKEPAKVRDEYGRNQAGARMLLARRLVEAGSRFVTLSYGGWDLHDNVQNGIRGQLPQFDQGYAALIRDLDRRGLLKSTLVCIASEFGRTPKINGTAGRDHWPKVFTVVMAGGGIKGGISYGTSNATASEPEDDPLSVEDWAATIYHCLGINPDNKLIAPGDRPINIVKDGTVRKELLV
jgi:Protein of unknown function (DUF1501)